MATYSYQRSFAHDPTLKGRLFALLETCFPGITQAERASLALGRPWEIVSTPFVSFQEDLAIAHVGLIDMPLVVMGQTRHVGGIHAVGTRPAYRRRGHYRQVMTEVLRYCAHRYDTLILATGQPALYEPFGFRVLQEYLFVCMVTPPSPGDAQGFRPFNAAAPSDLALLSRLLATRTPVSQVLGVVEGQGVFSFNGGSLPLYYAADLDVVVSYALDGPRLHLFDVVGQHIPPLEAILARLPQRVDQVVVYFSPDRLGADFKAIAHTLLDSPGALGGEGEDWLMVRGPFAAEGQPFMLPRSARC